MNTRRGDEGALPPVTWTAAANRSWRELARFIEASPGGDASARRREIDLAIELLRNTPLIGERVEVRRGREIRRIHVRRLVVYYIWRAGRDAAGVLSIRAVRHSAMERPFFGVRDSPQLPA